MTAQEIAEAEAGLSKVEADMRMGRSRSPKLTAAYFSAWGPHLIRDEAPPGDLPVGIGIDHGSKPGAQRAVLVAVQGRGPLARVWVLDEYQGDGRTESEEDARGIVDMLARHGMELKDVDQWVGDRGHRGDTKGGVKSNQRLIAEFARIMGVDVGRRGWTDAIPRPLAAMRTPRKYNRSVWDGMEILHRLMLGKQPRMLLSPRCKHLPESFSKWQCSFTDPLKDGLDALRYIVVPMIEGERH